MTMWATDDGEQPDGRGAAIRLHGARLLLALGLAVATYLLFPASPAVQLPVHEVGAVAPDNVIAPFAFRVAKAPAELERERDALARTVPPTFSYSAAALDSSRAQLAAFAAALDSVLAARPGDDAAAAASFETLAPTLGVRLTPAEVAYLRPPARRIALTRAVDRVFDRWLAAGAASNAALDNVRGQVTVARDSSAVTMNADSILTFTGMLAGSRLAHPDPGSATGDALFVRLLSTFFRPTLVPDRAATERRRAELFATVNANKYVVQAGEKIVGAHEVVGREEHEKLRALRDELQARVGGESSAGRVAGAVMYNALVIVIFGVTLVLFRPQLYQSMRVLTLFAVVFFLVLVSSAAVARIPASHPELIPIAFAAVLFSVLFDPRISLIAAMVLAVLIGGQSVFRGTNALFVNLVGGVAAAFSVRVVRRRNQAYHSMLIIGCGYALAAVAIGLTLGWEVRTIAISAGAGALNGIVSVALAMGLLPPAEDFTGIDTYLRLLEWSDLNRPLMQRLSLEAPGTYAHTIAIANLAEAGANAIGGNGLLARVGSYYHDIGKLKKPQYFVENQPKGRNPHDKLKPTTSASIIRNHVRDGLELAAEYKLPKTVRAFITEHHGTGKISYFLDRARERDGSNVNTTEFMYPGPPPQSAETAVVMLADGVEAAARVLQEPTPQKIRELVEHIVRQRVDQGQLRDAPLTLRQLEILKEQFARVLIGMYHSRIDYPAASGGVSSEFAAV
jgi:putative nucleotidyltransferase with HDIG domain